MSTLRDVPGVRTVEGNRLTGSVRIEYDPFRVAEDALVRRCARSMRVWIPAPGAGAAAEGAVEAADRIGTAAGRSVRQTLGGTVAGVRELLVRADPRAAGAHAGDH